jgi:release factor glutamine methyltransferase
MPGDGYRPMMSKERARRLRDWHNDAYEKLRASLPRRLFFMGLDLHISEDVFAPEGGEEGDPFHQAALAEVKPSDRVLDMGTGSGVSAILAAKVAGDVVAVDINRKAVECAIANAARNGVSDRISCFQSDVFDAVEGDFDLIIFDPPFRWFAPRDLLETSTADEDYRALKKFMAEAGQHLRPGGRILLNFGTSGDIDYLYSLIDRAGFAREVTLYGEVTKTGLTAQYYIVRLTRGTEP